MSELELHIARGFIERAEQNISEQRAIIARLEHEKRNSVMANELLHTFERSLDLARRNVVRLEHQD